MFYIRDVEIFEQVGRYAQAKEVTLDLIPSLQGCWVEEGLGQVWVLDQFEAVGGLDL